MNDSTDRVKLIFNAVLGTKHYISAESIILYHNGSGKNALVELHERIAKCMERDHMAGPSDQGMSADELRTIISMGRCRLTIQIDPPNVEADLAGQSQPEQSKTSTVAGSASSDLLDGGTKKP